MRQRDIDARVADFLDKTFGEKFDTILMAMNGIVGKIERLQEFFKRLKQILTPGVQVQLDSFYFVLPVTVGAFVVLRYT